jgi:hypothetical protein
MAAGLSHAAQQGILNGIFRGSGGANTGYRPLAGGATFYIALLTTMPTALNGTGLTEVSTSGTAYARVGFTVADGTWTLTAGSGTTPANIKNASAINWAQATANWGTVLGIGISTSSSAGDNTAGNWLIFLDLVSSQTVNNLGTFSFPINNLQINCA